VSVFLLTCVRELEMDVESTLKHMHISCYRKRDTNEGKRGCVCVCGFNPQLPSPPPFCLSVRLGQSLRVLLLATCVHEDGDCSKLAHKLTHEH